VFMDALQCFSSNTSHSVCGRPPVFTLLFENNEIHVLSGDHYIIRIIIIQLLGLARENLRTPNSYFCYTVYSEINL
jgi:hypothetical protein